MEISVLFDGIVSFLMGLSAKYPVIVPVLSVMYTVGLVSKVYASVKEFVLESPNKKDDEVLAKVEASSVFKAVKYTLDLFLRIKLK